jgi:hypothetical protein
MGINDNNEETPLFVRQIKMKLGFTETFLELQYDKEGNLGERKCCL